MAVCIDTAQLAQKFIPEVQNNLDGVTGGVRRFQVHRVCAHATVLRDLPLPVSEIGNRVGSLIFSHLLLAQQSRLDWQGDPDDDLDELKVLHRLQQQAPSKYMKLSSQNRAPTTLVASAMSPSFKARTHGRLLSSFHRYSLRCSSTSKPVGSPNFIFCGEKRESIISSILPNVVENPLTRIFTPDLEIVWASDSNDRYSPLLWQTQVDVVDLFSQTTHTTSRPRKRRRTQVNRYSFLQASDSAVVEDTSPENHLPHVKGYNGVRYRRDRRTWVAQMKPPKHRNKEDFGSFKSEAQAARAVDAAFHHYGTPHRLNFPDSPQILSTRPRAAAGLDEKAMLKFVKEEAKWLASPVTFEFRSISEISASVFSWGGGADEADDGVSHPPPVTTTGVETVDPNYVRIEELGQLRCLWIEEWVLIEDTDYLANCSHDCPSMWVDDLISSPPAPEFE